MFGLTRNGEGRCQTLRLAKPENFFLTFFFSISKHSYVINVLNITFGLQIWKLSHGHDCRLSICKSFDWLWQILRIWDEQACLLSQQFWHLTVQPRRIHLFSAGELPQQLPGKPIFVTLFSSMDNNSNSLFHTWPSHPPPLILVRVPSPSWLPYSTDSIFVFVSLYFITNIKVRNMKKYSREIC